MHQIHIVTDHHFPWDLSWGAVDPFCSSIFRESWHRGLLSGARVDDGRASQDGTVLYISVIICWLWNLWDIMRHNETLEKLCKRLNKQFFHLTLKILDFCSHLSGQRSVGRVAKPLGGATPLFCCQLWLWTSGWKWVKDASKSSNLMDMHIDGNRLNNWCTWLLTFLLVLDSDD